jgi:hypothetical protein
MALNSEAGACRRSPARDPVNYGNTQRLHLSVLDCACWRCLSGPVRHLSYRWNGLSRARLRQIKNKARCALAGCVLSVVVFVVAGHGKFVRQEEVHHGRISEAYGLQNSSKQRLNQYVATHLVSNGRREPSVRCSQR